MKGAKMNKIIKTIIAVACLNQTNNFMQPIAGRHIR